MQEVYWNGLFDSLRLGHVSVATTNAYIEIDMAMKRQAIERCTPPVPEPTGDIPWRSRQDIIEWLEDL